MKTGTTINLKFDANRGTVSQLSREGVYGEPFGVLPTPVRRGYTFCGWYCGDVLVSADAIIEADEDICLVARWEKAAPVADKKRSMLKRQKIAVAALAAVAVALIVTFVIVSQLISVYSFVDTYTVDGVEHSDKYYVKRHEGVYKLFDKDGNLMDTNGVLDTVFIARGSGNEYKINPDTGAHTLRAVVDAEDGEYASGSTLLVFPQLLSTNIHSIKMENEQDGNYKIFRTANGMKIEGFEDSQVELDQELFTQLCFSCGYLLANRKIGETSTDPLIPRLEDGSIDYSAYGLDTPQATYTVSGILFKKNADGSDMYQNGKYVIDYDADGNPQEDPERTYTVYVGDAIISGGGYYVRLEGRGSVYIITTDYIKSTILQPLEQLVVPRAVFPVSVTYHSMGRDFLLARQPEWDKETEVIVSFTYSELEERINTVDSTRPYIPLTSVMAGYNINDNSAISVFESFYSLECIACKQIVKFEDLIKDTEMREKYKLNRDVYWLSYSTFTGQYDENGNKLEATNELIISSKTEDGTYYVFAKPFDMIVEVDQSYLSFLEWDNIKWYSEAFIFHNISYMRDIHFTFGDTTYDLTLDNTLSYAYYKEGNALKAVDLSKGRVYTEGNKQKYELNGKVYDLIVIKWNSEGEDDPNAVRFVTQRDVTLNPDLENVIYVKETFYYVNEKGENVGLVIDYVNSDIEYVIERDENEKVKDRYYCYFDNKGNRIRVQRSLGDPIYHYQNGLEVTLSIDARGLKIYCDQYEGNDTGLLDYVIDKSGMGDDGTNKRETITATENFKKLHMQLLYFSLSGDVDEVEFKNSMGMTVDEFLKQDGKKPLAKITARVEDYAKYFNGHVYHDNDGNEIPWHKENSNQYFEYTFYQYTDWKVLVTVELFEKDENGNFVTTAEDGVVGKFYASTSVLDKLEKDIERLLNQEIIDSSTKY